MPTEKERPKLQTEKERPQAPAFQEHSFKSVPNGCPTKKGRDHDGHAPQDPKIIQPPLLSISQRKPVHASKVT